MDLGKGMIKWRSTVRTLEIDGEVHTLWGRGMRIEEVPPDSTVVHMVIQPTEERFAALKERCGALQRVELCPSIYYGFSFNDEKKRGLLEARFGIEITIGYWPTAMQRGINLDQRQDPAWVKKRNFLRNPTIIGKLLDFQDILGPDVERTLRYFCLGKYGREKRISLVDLARSEGVGYRVISKKILALLVLLGYPSQRCRKDVQHRVSTIRKRIKKSTKI